MALDPALPFERLGYDIDPEVGLSSRPVAGVTFVLMGFIKHAQAFRSESLGQLLRDEIVGSRHGFGLAMTGRCGQLGGNGNERYGQPRVIFICQACGC